jgi:hypothetical protein
MNIYHYAPGTGIFHAQGLADESPLEPGVFLIPACATTLEPPEAALPDVAVFRDGEWSVEALPPPVELTPAEKLAASGLTVDDLKELLGLD